MINKTKRQKYFALSPFQGFESLEDLEKNADLTFQQKIGIKHYDDINQKMPREEVAEIEKHVRLLTKNLKFSCEPSFQCFIYAVFVPRDISLNFIQSYLNPCRILY